MNSIKKFIIFAIFAISAQSMFAKNKDRVIFSNIYGADVAIALTWKNKAFPYLDKHQNKIIKKNQNVTFVAPVSTCHLVSINVTPAKNLNLNAQDIASLTMAGVAGGMMGAGVASGAAPVAVAGVILYDAAFIVSITKSHNHHTIHNAHNHMFFVIEKTHKNSPIKGQKQITIRGYTTQAHYDTELAALSTVQKDAQAVQEEPIVVETPAEQLVLTKSMDDESLMLQIDTPIQDMEVSANTVAAA